MYQYLDLARDVLANGVQKFDRTGTGTISVFGRTMRFDLADGFPLITTKQVHMKSVIEELLWFLRGETNIKSLVDKGVNIWTPDAHRAYREKGGLLTEDEFKEMIKINSDFADKHGDLGPIYGAQWVNWDNGYAGRIDQIAELIRNLIRDPDSRRHMVNAWNVGDLHQMVLPPCHYGFQCYVSEGRLSLKVDQRSCDLFLGVPFNIASYALLLLMIAQVTNLEPGELIWNGGDVHIYNNHIEQINLQLERDPKPLPTMHLNPDIVGIFDFKYDDFILDGYDPHPKITGQVSVG